MRAGVAVPIGCIYHHLIFKAGAVAPTLASEGVPASTAIPPAPDLADPVTRIVARQEEKPRGIPRRFTRVSIGREEPEELISDFKQASERCR